MTHQLGLASVAGSRPNQAQAPFLCMSVKEVVRQILKTKRNPAHWMREYSIIYTGDKDQVLKLVPEVARPSARLFPEFITQVGRVDAV